MGRKSEQKNRRSKPPFFLKEPEFSMKEQTVRNRRLFENIKSPHDPWFTIGRLPHYLYNFQKCWKIPRNFFNGQNFDKENPESLGILYLLKCNSQNYIIYSTDMCRSCQGKTTAAYQGNIPVSSLFLPIWYPPSTGPETPDSWQPSALETCVFQRRFLQRFLWVSSSLAFLFCGFLGSSSLPASAFCMTVERERG